MNQKSFLIYGAGAIGNIICYSLLKANQKVYLFCRKDNYKF